jgi:hypothetical protein
MKYDCPKCQRNLKGEDLWAKEHFGDEARFACPGCGTRLAINAHAAEVGAGLFCAAVIVGLFVVTHLAYGLTGVVILGVVFLVVGAPVLLGLGSWIHRNKQRYRAVEHAH